MAEVQTHLIRLQVDSETHYVAKSEVSEADIILTVLCDDQAVLVRIEKETLKEMGEKMRLKEIESWAEEAFTTSSKDFVFVIDDDNELVWRRSGGSSSKVKIKIGSFPAQTIDLGDAQRDVFAAATSKIDSQGERIETFEKKMERMEKALKESHEKMDELCREKSELETKMLEQFLPILQAKKDKLREMRAGKGAGQSQTSTQDDQEEDYGSGTDVDEEETPSKKRKGDDGASSMNDSQNFLNI